MGTQKRTWIRRNEAEWSRLVSRFESSKLDAVSFCERESLSLSSLQRWRKRLSEGSADAFVEIPLPSSPSRSRSQG